MSDEITRNLLNGGSYDFANEVLDIYISLDCVILRMNENGVELDEHQISEMLLTFRYPSEEDPAELPPDGRAVYGQLQQIADVLAARFRLRERASAAG